MYFNNPQTLDELRKQYRDLALKYHPDRNGSHEAMVQINAEYEDLQQRLKRSSHASGSHKQDIENDEKLREIILNLVALPLSIEIIGSWIWVDQQDSYLYKDRLKELKFQWARSKKKWYWFNGIEQRRQKSRISVPHDQIKQKYGSYTVRMQEPKQLT